MVPATIVFGGQQAARLVFLVSYLISRPASHVINTWALSHSFSIRQQADCFLVRSPECRPSLFRVKPHMLCQSFPSSNYSRNSSHYWVSDFACCRSDTSSFLLGNITLEGIALDCGSWVDPTFRTANKTLRVRQLGKPRRYNGRSPAWASLPRSIIGVPPEEKDLSEAPGVGTTESDFFLAHWRRTPLSTEDTPFL